MQSEIAGTRNVYLCSVIVAVIAHCFSELSVCERPLEPYSPDPLPIYRSLKLHSVEWRAAKESQQRTKLSPRVNY